MQSENEVHYRLMRSVLQRSELQARELQTLTEEKRVLLEYAVAMQRKVTLSSHYALCNHAPSMSEACTDQEQSG